MDEGRNDSMALHLNAYRDGCAIVATILVGLITGCQDLTAVRPPVPIHYVAIEDGVSDADLRTKVGEEVRWVNVRKTPVSVVFDGLGHGDVSCGHGFSNSTNAHVTAVILPDHHASLCFSTAGRRTYRVFDANRREIELNHEAAVEIVASP
jgi:hypothetical protein